MTLLSHGQQLPGCTGQTAGLTARGPPAAPTPGWILHRGYTWPPDSLRLPSTQAHSAHTLNAYGQHGSQYKTNRFKLPPTYSNRRIVVKILVCELWAQLLFLRCFSFVHFRFSLLLTAQTEMSQKSETQKKTGH